MRHCGDAQSVVVVGRVIDCVDRGWFANRGGNDGQYLWQEAVRTYDRLSRSLWLIAAAWNGIHIVPLCQLH